MSVESTISETSAGAPSRSLTDSDARGFMAADGPVIFFDGVCGLCNRWVDFVLARDRQGVFRFAPLQGETARDWLRIEPGQPLNSVVLVDHHGVYRKSDAIWRMLIRLGGIWIVPGWLLRLTPRPLRQWGYDLVARRRYRWFGKKEACRLPRPQERARFLP
jgi:predicted DCC family thiol-disulfide oxidoreductase YuxK